MLQKLANSLLAACPQNTAFILFQFTLARRQLQPEF